MRLHRSLPFLRAVAYLKIVSALGTGLGLAQDPAAILTEGVALSTSSETTTLERDTQRLASHLLVNVRNSGSVLIDAPLHVLVGFTGVGTDDLTGLAVPGALGGVGLGPYGTWYLDCSDKAGPDGFAPGESFELTLRFDRPRTLQVRYDLQLAGVVNLPPLALSGGPYRGTRGQPITLDGSGSSDPEGGPLAFRWTLPDGSILAGSTVEASFPQTGLQQVHLEVTDNRGMTSRIQVAVAVLPTGEFALGRTRVLDGLGHPLDAVQIAEDGPGGSAAFLLQDGGFGSLGSVPGDYLWRFSKPGYLGVCRRATLVAGEVSVVPNPWMQKLGTSGVPTSVLNPTQVNSADGSVQIAFPGGTFTQIGQAILTELHGQALPAPLPPGWSPLRAFHLALPQTPLLPGSLNLTIPAGLPTGRQLVLCSFDPANCEWSAKELPAVDGDSIAASLDNAGSIVLALPDGDPTAPPAPTVGAPLPGFAADALPAGLAASGLVDPPETSASLDSDAVTTRAAVDFTGASALPSGTWFQGDLRERYSLSDGRQLLVPAFDQTYYVYRNYGDVAETVTAEFPLRPTLLFGPEELNVAQVQVEVVGRLLFSGGVVDPGGGVLAAGDVRVTLPPDAVLSPAAAGLRALPGDDFLTFAGGLDILSAFALDLGELEPDIELGFAFSGPAPANSHFLLARLTSAGSRSGLRPVMRLASDAGGTLASVEPVGEPRLDGIRGPGTYLLLQTPAPLGLVQGLTMDPAAAPLPGVAVSVLSTPWLCVSNSGGHYELVATEGPGSLFGQQLSTGDSGTASFTIDSALSPLALDLTIGPAGPSVIATTPLAGASAVSRVTPIAVTFSEPVHPATFGPDAVVLRLLDSGDVVPGSLSLAPGNATANLLPTNPLDYETDYVIEVTATLADPGGLLLEGARLFGFRTKLSPARGPGAQLVIYEPGATNIPPEVLADLVGYEPGVDTDFVVCTGTQGTADPEVPVILVNEISGETVTVLSKPDGSFSSFIRADEEDFIRAVFVNAIGTRVSVPATRQLFDTGAIGLYRYGGILEAESDGGPVQILIAPDAIPNRSKFMVDVVPLVELFEFLEDTVPNEGTLLGGVRIEIDGDPLKEPVEVVFPVDPATLVGPEGQAPEDGIYALCEKVEVDGEIAFGILDKMEYEDGTLRTASPPFPGVGGQLIGTVLAMPMQMIFGTRLTVVGKIVSGPPGSYSEDEILNGVSASGTPLPRVPGAIVGVVESAFDTSGRLRPGGIVARANSLGFYTLLYSYNAFGHPALGIIAQSFRYPGARGIAAAPAPTFELGVTPVMTLNAVIPVEEGVTDDTAPPVVTVRPPTAVLPVGESVEVEFILRDNATEPSFSSTAINVGASQALIAGQTVEAGDVTFSLEDTQVLAPNLKQITYSFFATKSVLAAFETVAVDAAGNMRESLFRLRFGAAPTGSGTNPLPADANDETPPTVVASLPGSGTVFAGNQITLRFSEPVKDTITTNASAVTMLPTALTELELDASQRILTVRFLEPEPDTDYELRLPAWIVEDLNDNTMEEDYVLNFSTPELPIVQGSALPAPRGAATHGAFAYVIDNDIGNEQLNVYRVGDSEDPAPAGSIGLPPWPRSLVVIPNYSYYFSAHPDTGVPAGLRTDRTLVAVTGGIIGGVVGPWLWIVDVTDPANPERVASSLVTADGASTVINLRWKPPHLAAAINSVEFSAITLVNLQGLIVGSNGFRKPAYMPGLDLNGDGDYVDTGEKIPTPEVNTLFGTESVVPVMPGATIVDFDYAANGGMAAALRLPASGESRAQVLLSASSFIGDGSSPDGAVVAPAGTSIKRVLLDPDFLLTDATGIRAISAMIVSRSESGGVDQFLEVYDLTNPVTPLLVRQLELSDDMDIGAIRAIEASGPSELTVATTSYFFIIDTRLLGRDDPMLAEQSILMQIAQGSPGRNMGASEFALVTSTGAIVNRPPRLSVVQIPGEAAIGAAPLKSMPADDIDRYLANATESPVLLPFLPVSCDIAGAPPAAPFDPADAALHHYVRMRASGHLGATIKVAAESLLLSGDLQPPKGELHPPVVLSDRVPDLGGIEDGQPDVEAIELVRLSDNVSSALYNEYISSPFVVSLARLSPDQEAAVPLIPGRKVILSGNFLRFSLDPDDGNDLDLDPWESEIANKVLLAGVHRMYDGVPVEYLESQNPSPIRGSPRLGGIDLQTGEFSSADTDIVITGRHQDLILTRAYESRAQYSGPFGPGWDFNFNARIVAMPASTPPDFKIALLGRGGSECDEWTSGDVLFIDGAGNVHLFKQISAANGNLAELPAYSSDPAVTTLLDGEDKIATYYQSPEGFFSMLYKLTDGSWALVHPSAHRMHFLPGGRLDRMVGAFQESVLQLVYRGDGLLDRVEGDRGAALEFDYHFPFLSLRRQGFDVPEENRLLEGRIARIRCAPTTISQYEVEYDYDPATGALVEVIPNVGDSLVYGHDANDPGLIESIEVAGAGKIPKQTLDYDADTGMVLTAKVGSYAIVPAGAKETWRERIDEGTSSVSAGGDLNATFDLDDRGRVSGFANREYDYDEDDQPAKFEGTENGVEVTYDTSNPVHRFRGNLLRTERYSVGDPGQRFITKTEYDGSAFNRIMKVTDIEGDECNFSYTGDPFGTVTATESRGGAVVQTLIYNEFGQLKEDTMDSSGSVFKRMNQFLGAGPDTDLETGEVFAVTQGIGRDQYGRLDTATSPANTTTTVYDGSQITGQNSSNADFPTISFTYDDLGRVEAETTMMSGASVDIAKTFDAAHPGKPKTTTWTETGVPPSTATHVYNAAGAMTSMTVDGEETTFTIDANGRVTDEDGPGVHKSVTYTGNLVTSITENGVSTEFVHDGAGRVEEMMLRGAKHTFIYEDAGDGIGERYKTKTIEGSGGTTLVEESYTYDGAGRLIEIDSLGGRQRVFTRFPDGGIKTMAIDGTILTEIARDDRGRLVSSRANQVRLSFGGYDGATASPQSETMTVLNGSASLTTTKSYDDHGRLEKVTTPSGSWDFDYDGWGNLLSKTDPDGVSVGWTRSPSGYLLGVEFFDGTSVTYNYNPQRKIDTITSANGTVDYDYDAEGLTRMVEHPDGTTQAFGMRNGFLEATQMTYGSIVQTFGYDANGRVDSITCPTGEIIEYDYDALGRRTSAVLDGHGVSFGYQPDGELISETHALPFLALPQAYRQTLSGLNHLVSETYPSGHVVDFAPDGFGEATSASAAGVTSIDWFAPGATQNIFYGSNIRVIRDYDAALRLTGIRYLQGTSVDAPLAVGFAYELTGAGRVKHEEKIHRGEFDVFTRNAPAEGMRISGFAFGAADKMGTGAVAGIDGFTFVSGELHSPATLSNPDPSSGDLRGFHADINFGTGRRPVSIAGSAITYDDLGSMTTFPLWVRLPGQSGLTQVDATASYDGFGNVRSIARGDGVDVTYTRDGLGRIVRRQVSGPAARVTPSDTAYVWADSRLLEEYADVGSGFQLLRRYHYLGGDLLGLQSAPVPGGTLTSYVPAINRSGSTCGYLALDGTLLETIDYSAYGMPVFRSGTDDLPLHSSSIGQTLLFQRGFFDGATGLYFLGQRTLSPMTGLFLQRDGEYFTQDLAFFTAFSGDPAGMADPTGLQAVDASATAKRIKDAYEAAKSAATSAQTARLNATHHGLTSKEARSAGLDAAAKGIKLANKFSEDPLISDDLVDTATGTIDQIKTGLGILEQLGEMRKERDLLSAVQSVQNGFAPAKGGRWGWLTGAGASATSGLPSAVSKDVQANKWYRGALIARASSQEAIDAQSEHVRSEFLKKRKSAMLSVGSGLSTLSKALRERYLKGSDYPSVLSNQGLASAEKIFDAVKKGSEALEWLNNGAIKRDFFNPKKVGLVNALSAKPRSAISAAWTAGFEVGKFIAVATSDPETAKEYNRLAAQFEKDGGFLTVFSGVLSTVGLDETAYAIQQYQDYNLMEELAKPVTNYVESLSKERERQGQYLRGISAP